MFDHRKLEDAGDRAPSAPGLASSHAAAAAAGMRVMAAAMTLVDAQLGQAVASLVRLLDTSEQWTRSMAAQRRQQAECLAAVDSGDMDEMLRARDRLLAARRQDPEPLRASA